MRLAMIDQARKKDLQDIVRLALALWPDHDEAEFMEEFAALLENPDAAVFLVEDAGRAVGFAQVQLRRDYVEGTESSPAGYLEGIFVEETFRGRGAAGELLKACENWAREKGCAEFASDCELNNTGSLAWHLSAGFTEANRVICFVKRL